MLALQGLQNLEAIASYICLVAQALQHAQSHFLINRVIFCQEDGKKVVFCRP